MIEILKLYAANKWGSCNFCTEKGNQVYDVKSDNPNRNMVITICEPCLTELIRIYQDDKDSEKNKTTGTEQSNSQKSG
jgi:hypothetical protein